MIYEIQDVFFAEVLCVFCAPAQDLGEAKGDDLERQKGEVYIPRCVFSP